MYVRISRTRILSSHTSLMEHLLTQLWLKAFKNNKTLQQKQSSNTHNNKYISHNIQDTRYKEYKLYRSSTKCEVLTILYPCIVTGYEPKG